MKYFIKKLYTNSKKNQYQLIWGIPLLVISIFNLSSCNFDIGSVNCKNSLVLKIERDSSTKEVEFQKGSLILDYIPILNKEGLNFHVCSLDYEEFRKSVLKGGEFYYLELII